MIVEKFVRTSCGTGSFHTAFRQCSNRGNTDIGEAGGGEAQRWPRCDQGRRGALVGSRMRRVPTVGERASADGKSGKRRGQKAKTGLAARSCRRSGGGGEIRTHGRVAPSPVFKTGAFNRSATPPKPGIVTWNRRPTAWSGWASERSAAPYASSLRKSACRSFRKRCPSGVGAIVSWSRAMRPRCSASSSAGSIDVMGNPVRSTKRCTGKPSTRRSALSMNSKGRSCGPTSCSSCTGVPARACSMNVAGCL